MKKPFLISVTLVLLLLAVLQWHRQRSQQPVSLPSAPKKQTTRKNVQRVIAGKTIRTPLKTSPVIVASAPVSVRPVVDSTQPFSKRYAGARALSKIMREPALNVLKNFLLQKNEKPGQRDYALKNEVMDVLCTQEKMPADLTSVLAKVYHDPEQDVVIRDYAVQHLVKIYVRLGQSQLSATQIRTQENEIREVLWESLSESDSSIAGTALLGLSRLSTTRSEFDREKIAQAAMELAQDERASGLTRVTAFQICAQMQVKESLDLLMKTAEESQDVSLKISAIAGVGSLGGENELRALKKISTEENPRLQPALSSALASMQKRLGQ